LSLIDISFTTGGQIFHCKSWNVEVQDELIAGLIEEARINENRKARLCLHPNAQEIMQVTYLAFVSPYEDRIHSHPFRPEVLIPIQGEAEARIFDENGKMVKKSRMIAGRGHAFATESGQWHSLIVKSSEFVMIEIGIGPFRPDSTLYQE
jgi:cupin fold WbuC family metalloprotein